MGCWISYITKRLTSDAVSAEELMLLCSLPLLCPSRQTAPFSTLSNYSKPCIYRAVPASAGSFPDYQKEPDYSCFRLLSAVKSRLLPLGASFWLCCLPAAAHLCTSLLVRAERDAQRAGVEYPGFAWVSGSIQHSLSQEDAKPCKAAARKEAASLLPDSS